MKILTILFRVPYPLKDGGAIALYNVVKSLSNQGNDVTILSFNTTKHFVDPLPKEITSLGKVETVKIDNRVKALSALFNLFGSTSYHVQRFQSQVFDDKLKEILQEETFDIIHFDGLFTSIYLDTARKYAPTTKCVLRQHNVEHQIWERIAEGASGLKKLYLNILSSRLKKFEDKKVPQFDAVIPITSLDGKAFEKMGAKMQYVLPVGVDVEISDGSIVPERNSVFHLGSLDWMPNQEGIRWFVDSIWPKVVQENPSAKFYIAGREMPDWVRSYHEKNNVFVLGEVENALDFMESKEIMIVPLKSGSGMRVKIIEGFAAKKAIVSTTVGAEGIEYTTGKNIEIADTEKEFTEKIINLLSDQTKVQNLGDEAHQLVTSKYNNEATIKGLLSFYSELVKK